MQGQWNKDAILQAGVVKETDLKGAVAEQCVPCETSHLSTKPPATKIINTE